MPNSAVPFGTFMYIALVLISLIDAPLFVIWVTHYPVRIRLTRHYCSGATGSHGLLYQSPVVPIRTVTFREPFYGRTRTAPGDGSGECAEELVERLGHGRMGVDLVAELRGGDAVTHG